jgi:hypothetical protein
MACKCGMKNCGCCSDMEKDKHSKNQQDQPRKEHGGRDTGREKEQDRSKDQRKGPNNDRGGNNNKKW